MLTNGPLRKEINRSLFPLFPRPASKKSGLLGRFQYSTHLFLPIPRVVGISGSIRTRSPFHSFMGATLCSHSPPGHQVISQLNPFFHPRIFTLGLTLFDLP